MWKVHHLWNLSVLSTCLDGGMKSQANFVDMKF